MMVAEWGEQLFPFPFFIPAWKNPQIIPAICSEEGMTV
jgi:hypothetical protein